MNMHIIDWAIVAALLAFVIWAAYKTKKYTRSVADFLAANRCAGKYLLAVSEGIAGIGAISTVALFESYYKGGFSFAWWFFFFNLVVIVVALSGWVVCRLRETRALTLAQFLEMRYSKNFRITAGFVIFICGVINFGIFPAVGAKFFVHYCGLPTYEIYICSWLTIEVTYALIMLILLAIAIMFTFLGGQIAVMVTDFIQGTFSNILLCIIIAFVIIKIPWPAIAQTLTDRPPGESMVHPFQATGIEDFNLWYYLIFAFGLFYTTRAWQGNQGYFVAAINPHEARMGNIMGWWRLRIQESMTIILPVCAFALMHHANWTPLAEAVNAELATIDDETIRQQVTTTVTLTHLFPVGILGAFAAVMLTAFISNHDTYLHSWGSIFVQDILLPLRKNRLTTKQHIKWLRIAIFGVAAFIFLFSLLFPQNQYIYMYFALTGTIWLGGAGAVIVAGLYWKRGTTGGAYGAIIVGIITALIGFFLPRIWQIDITLFDHTFWKAQPEKFPLNAQWLWFIAMISSTVVYVIISLLQGKIHNMDKLLHRGEYAVADDQVTSPDATGVPAWQKILGINKDFHFKDKIIYLSIVIWVGLAAIVFIVVTAWNFIEPFEAKLWATFWHIYIWLILALGIITTTWLTIGGLFDLKKMFRRLASVTRDEKDDGTVNEQEKSLTTPEQ